MAQSEAGALTIFVGVKKLSPSGSAKDQPWVGTPEAQSGIVKSWDDDKGFGFIVPDDGSPDVFFHITSFANREVRPSVNAPIGYLLDKDERGRLRASSAWLHFGKTSSRRRRGWGPWVAAFLATDFIGALGVAAWSGWVHSAVPIVYLVMSIATLAVYTWDKARAQRGGDRVAEANLHLLEMLGGWPGALVAQQWLRHKSRKLPYQVRFWVIVICHLSLWGWLGFRAAGAQ